jgi:hypothetical protein
MIPAFNIKWGDSASNLVPVTSPVPDGCPELFRALTAVINETVIKLPFTV